MTSTDIRQQPIDVLTSNGKITESHIRKLRSRGFETIDDIALMDKPQKMARALGMSSESLVNIVLTAQSLGKYVIRKGQLRFPRGYPIYFDIETTTNWDDPHIWLLGMVDGRDMTYSRCYADTYNDEKQILIDFDDYLTCRPNMPLYHFSGTNFDIRVVRNICRKYGLYNHHIFRHPHIDILPVIRNAFYVPTPDMKLKTLARFLGYDMTLEDRNDYMDGKECALHYEQHVNFNTPLDHNVFKYNENDVYMLEFVLRTLTEVCIDR